jgi:hypothetical protein
LPEASYQTVFKISKHLNSVFQSVLPDETTSPVKLRREMAITWATPIFGLSTLEVFQKQKRSHDNRIFFVEILIQHFEVLFGKVEENVPFETETPVTETVEDFYKFPVDIFIGEEGNEVVCRRIPKDWTTRQLVSDLVAQLAASGNTANYEMYAIHEVIPPGIIRTMTLSENVFRTTQSWPTPFEHRLVFKYSPIKQLLSAAKSAEQESSDVMTPTRSATPSPFETKGWLYKEGVSIKSWKKRYFWLRRDYIYYFRNEKCTVENLVGRLP